MKQLQYTLQQHLTTRLIPVSLCIISALVSSALFYFVRSYQINTPSFRISVLPSQLKYNNSKQEIIACAPFINNYYYAGLETVEPNNNRTAAGKLKDGVLTINLEAREGVWYPETPVNPGIPVYAFAEAGKPLQLPGPLIRVPEGTEINLSIRNNISGNPLMLHGFHARPGDEKDSVAVEPGTTWYTRFKTGTAGTFYYKGTMVGRRIGNWPIGKDGQLYGGIIIDKAGVKPDTAERVFLIGRVIERLDNQPERVAVSINGLSWPYTERLTYKAGEPVKWRIINSSSIGHPMHLHGFYFNVHSVGDAETDNQYSVDDSRRVVTQLLLIGQTMRMSWIPERSGNWLFHCHMIKHISPDYVRLRPKPLVKHDEDLQHHVQEDMAGLIMGIHVLPNKEIPEKKPVNIKNRRQLNLLVKEYSSPFDSIRKSGGLGFVLQENKTEAATVVPSMPGPAIIIHQNEPVAINVTNQSNEATVIHWHGIELENYFDGVAGWGFQGNQVSPLIATGQSFTALITAPRAGTFMYHSHMHDTQLQRGMYGPLIVLKPGEIFDSVTDKILVISSVRRFNTIGDFKYLINGNINAEPLQLKKGKKYRLRLINITEDGWAVQATFSLNKNPVKWKALAKDGADLPAHQSIITAAIRQPIAVGETRDFEFLPEEPGEYKFEVFYNIPSLNVKIVEMLIIVK